MAQIDDLYSALKAADAAGDTAGAQKLADYIRTIPGTPSVASGPTPSATPQTGLDRYIQGVKDPINGGAQLLTKILPDSVVQAGNAANNWIADKTGLVAKLPPGGVDQQVREGEAQYQADRAAAGNTGFDGSRLLGNIFNPVSIGTGAVVPSAVSTLGRVGVGTVAGGATSLLNPVTQGDFATEKAKQVALGSFLGGAAPVVTNALARIISPNATRNPNLNLLRSEGVDPTIGQSLGGRFNALEEKLQSVPILGDAIANARGKALSQFNTAAINRASGQVGAKIEGTGQTAVREAGDALSQAYDDALNQVQHVTLDPQFQGELAQLQGAAQNLVPSMRDKFNNTVSDIVLGRAKNGTMLGDTYKKVDSEIGNLAAKYGKSSVASEGELGDAFSQLQSLLRQQMARTNPQVAQALSEADAGWANLVRIEGAAKAAKNAEGIFTPAQLNAAVQSADKSVRGRAVSRGEALLQDLAGAGQSVLGNKVPNSFTTDRMLLAGGTLGSYLVNPAIPAGLLGGAAAYSAPGQKILNALATQRPQNAEAVANALRRASPALIPGAAQVGANLLK